MGERLATSPGALAAAVSLAASTGARLAWIPRRAGERGALEAGALGALLPGGRPVTDAAARGEVAAVWEVASLPATPGRDTAGIVSAAASGALGALVVGGVDPGDLALPQVSDALAKAFVISLEIRESAVTAVADVVLPVAPHAEKAGSFVNWEGRVRPFEAALTTNSMSDHRVLDMLAAELGVFLETRTQEQINDQFEALGPWTGARATSSGAANGGGTAYGAGDGDVVLATWPLLLDRGRMQDGEPFLAGTARASVARVGAALAARLAVVDGDEVTVSSGSGSVSVPVLVADGMVDGVVWLPTNSLGCAVRSTLGVDAGARVTVTKGGAR